MNYEIEPYPALPSVITVPSAPRRIDMFLMHATGGVKTGDLWTLSGRDRAHQVSVHYYITKLGDIYQLVQDTAIAWHAGESFWEGETDCNRFSLGCELENWNNGLDPYPTAQLDAVTWLARSKVQQYRIPRSRLVRHAQVALPPGRKTDPRGFPWNSFVEEVYRVDASHLYPRRYRVKPGGATIRQAWWRPAAGESDNEAGKMPAGTLVDCDEIKFGQVVLGSDEWLHLADGRGFVHASALERV